MSISTINARSTKAELIAHIQYLGEQLAQANLFTLEANEKLANAQAHFRASQAKLALNAQTKPVFSKAHVHPSYNRKPMPQWQIDRAQAMADARNTAMQSGSVVKVG